MQTLKKIYRIFAVPLFQDNYSYIIEGTAPKALVLVDPANPAIVMKFVNSYFSQYMVSHVLYTHKHWDHAGGSKQLADTLLSLNSSVKIIIGEHDLAHVKGPNYSLSPEQTLQIGQSIVKTVHVPCHTRGHTIYSFLPLSDSVLTNEAPNINDAIQGRNVRVFDSHSCTFTGDTLFVGGVGRFFQGNAAEMTQNINKMYKILDEDSDIFCGHQYAIANLQWGCQMEKDNQAMKQLLTKLSNQQQPCSIPSSLRQEREINIFVRAVTGSPLKSTISGNSVELMNILRQMKNKNLTQYQGKGSL